MEHKDKADAILQYWFGEAEGVALPSQELTHKWFASDPKIDAEVKEKFQEDYKKALNGDYASWENTARGTLALIVLFDQYSRHMYRNTPQSFAQDQKALDLCLKGIERQYDHLL